MESKFLNSKQRYSGRRILNLILTVILLSTMVGCAGNTSSVTTVRESKPKQEFHADFDIAMTLRSIADALRVGEPLDSTEYDYEGILTDGQGHPLYTDIQGAPGVWQIDVTTPTSVVIRNIYLGDLLPKDLEVYIAGNLNLTENDIISTTEYDDDAETELTLYKFDGGYLRIETRAAIAPNGLEGPLMSIIASKEIPSDFAGI